MKKLSFALLIAATSFLVGCSKSDKTEQASPVASPNAQASTSASANPDAAGRPNVIFILVDDMGFGDVGYNGSEIATPNLDQMASAGMKLDRNYVYSICSPTRAGLLTGHNPLHYGIDGPIATDNGMPRDLKIMPEYFKELGYQTFMVGKWHLGIGNTDYWPASRGFESHYGFLAGSIDYYTHVYAGGLDWQRDGASLREEGHATDLLTAEAKRVIDNRDPDSPFLLYLAYNAPHAPLQTTPIKSGLNEKVEAGNRYVYAEMVTQVDGGIGQVIAELKDQGILENTIVVFSSDNGGSLHLGSNNGRLRGAKGNPWEGGIRVPGLIMWADHIAAGQVLEQQIVVHDWLPTLLDAVGADSSRIEKPYGQSMWPAIDGGAEIERAHSVIGSGESRCVFDWPWKLVRVGADGEHELYNVLEDPYEQKNLAQAQPKILASLEAVLAAMPVVPTRRSVIKGGSGARPRRGVDLDYEARAKETRSPWAEAAVRGSN